MSEAGIGIKQARGEVKRLLRVIGELQSLIGEAKGYAYADTNQESFAKEIGALEKAFQLCLDTTEPYDPNSYDPFFCQDVTPTKKR